VYGTFSLGGKYDYDPDTRAFYFVAGNTTFKYDPKAKEWTDLRRRNGPEGMLGGVLLWSSMCYDRDAKQFVLFGGGNVQTERGGPGNVDLHARSPVVATGERREGTATARELASGVRPREQAHGPLRR